MAPIVKSPGVTPTERLLAELCDHTFLTLWSYSNPFKDDGKELCDLLVVFDDRVFLFFDRESREFDSAHKDFLVSWKRWKKKAIDKQIKTAKGAEKYILSGRSIFVDPKKTKPFPIAIPKDAKISKFVVAHGAKEACKAFSEDNVSGSLRISYSTLPSGSDSPFHVRLDKEDIVHVLDSHTLEILFAALDTIYDFSDYIEKKEKAIAKYDAVLYCGEEDLIAHYFQNYDPKQNIYRIGPKNGDRNRVYIDEGEWKKLIDQRHLERRRKANKVSYAWDKLIEIPSKCSLNGGLKRDEDPLLRGKGPLHEMAKEPRQHRRMLSEEMYRAVEEFSEAFYHKTTFINSFFDGVGYVFLQLRYNPDMDYKSEYLPHRMKMLGVACGVAKNRYACLKKVVGIAVDAPTFPRSGTGDFTLLECEKWSTEQSEECRQANKSLGFFETGERKISMGYVMDFPIED